MGAEALRHEVGDFVEVTPAEWTAVVGLEPGRLCDRPGFEFVHGDAASTLRAIELRHAIS